MKPGALAPDKVNHVWGLMATLLWGLLVMACFFLTQLVVMQIYITVVHGDVTAGAGQQLVRHLENDGVLLSFSTIATFIVCGLLLLGIVALKKGASPRSYLALNPVSGPTLRNWLILVFVLILLSDAITVMLNRPLVPEFVSNLYLTTKPIWLLWLAFIIAAPLFEELFFRGFLFTGLASSTLRPTGAIVLTAVAWSLVHFQYDWYGIITVFVLGLVFGYARFTSGSVLLTVALHSFVNFVATVEAALFVD
jgi:membrane protease YdiL (CAAX protease family)